MQAWDDFLIKLEPLLGNEVVEKWLRTMKVVHFDSGNLYLEAKDTFQILWFEEHVRSQLKSNLLNNNFRPIKVHITASEIAPAPTRTKPVPKQPTPLSYPPDQLDPAMTLENFITGESNQILLKLIHELTTSRKTAYNPIYIWGAPGCGKTHLLMALAQAFQKQGLTALYAKAETFTEHVVTAIRASEMQSFRKAYRHPDILLIDDVHLFARKDATQEEFFHTFNTLHTSGRQIILSSQCTPAHLKEIEPRLVSRFEWGINVSIQKLSPHDLQQILISRSESFDFPLPDEILHYLIATFPTAQSLHKALEALILRSHLSPTSLSLSNARKMLADLEDLQQQALLTPEKIIASVAAIYGIRPDDLLSKSQSQECSLPRQIAMYLCRQELKLPYQKIGSIFSRDHSTVITSIRHITTKIALSDRDILASITTIRSKI
jgi:chromosomal replication initiator protein